MIDLPGTTLLPGLIDAHSHIFLHPYNEAIWNDQVMKETLAYRTIAAVIYCKDTLLAGFTSLRDLGTEGAEYADVSVQKAINEGRIPGPRLQVATKAIVATASYGPGPRGFATNFELPRGAEEVSGVDQMLWAVRDQIGHGADWVKLYADYRRGPNGSNVPTLTLAEMQAAVEEAKSAGRPVAVHASHPEGMRRAVVAGAQTIEHGYGGTDEIFALMAEKGVALLPDARRPGSVGDLQPGLQARRVEADPVARAGPPRVPVGPRSTTSSSASAATWACSRTAPTRASWS